MAVRFGVLGEVEALIDGQPVELGHARQRCVLAALLVDAGRVVSVEQLSERVWGDRFPATAGRTLASYVSRLRSVLDGAEEVDIQRRPAGYLLTVGSGSVDLHHFRDLVSRAGSAEHDDQALALLDEAIGLWRGEALTGLTSPWLDTTREALHQQRLAAELDRNDVELRLGRHHELLPRLSAQAAAHPFDERCAGQLMLALYRCGRQADALDSYQRIRARLADQLGVDPSPVLQQLYRQLLTADPAVGAGVATTAAAASGVRRLPLPRQLPAPPRVFVGRSAELTALDGATRAGGPVTILAVGGAGGIGKTALALHWSHRNLDRFPDGQLHADLRGFDSFGTPTPPSAVLRAFLHALGVAPAAVPPDLDAQAGLYRSLTAGKRMLVLLDNAHDADQIEPLLPGGSECLAVITSRRRLTTLLVRGAHLLDLDVLTPDDAAGLLISQLATGRAATEPAAFADLLRWCAGMPLAIVIAAARANQHPRFPLAVLAEELRDTATRLDALDAGELATNLRAVLSWSYRALSPATARVFRLLGLAPGPDISLPAAAGLAGLPAPRTRALMRDLEHAHLVTEHVPGRYRMHDLTRLYAAERAVRDTREQDRRAALRRVVGFYLHTAHAGALQLDPQRPPIRLARPAPDCHPHPLPDPEAATAWFDAEHSGLLAAQQAAAVHGWHEVVWQLAWTLNTVLRRRGHLHDGLTVWRAGLTAADHLGDATAQTLAHRLLGTAYARVGRHGEALDHLRRALALAERDHDRHSQAHAHWALAGAWGQRGDYQAAREHAAQALRLYRAIDAPALEAVARNNLGWYAARMGDYHQARIHCQLALAEHRRHHDRTAEAHTLDSLGYIAHHTGQQARAIDYYGQALTLFRHLGDTYEEANTLANLGHLYAALGRHQQARAAWQQALDLYLAQHRSDAAARVRHRLARQDHGSGERRRGS